MMNSFRNILWEIFFRIFFFRIKNSHKEANFARKSPSKSVLDDFCIVNFRYCRVQTIQAFPFNFTISRVPTAQDKLKHAIESARFINKKRNEMLLNVARFSFVPNVSFQFIFQTVIYLIIDLLAIDSILYKHSEQVYAT